MWVGSVHETILIDNVLLFTTQVPENGPVQSTQSNYMSSYCIVKYGVPAMMGLPTPPELVTP